MLLKRELTGPAKTCWNMAQYIRKHGWCQNQLYNGKAACIVGAYYCVRDKFDTNPIIGGTLRGYMGCRPQEWNDMPGRTKEEVIDKLEEIAWKLADDA